MRRHAHQWQIAPCTPAHHWMGQGRSIQIWNVHMCVVYFASVGVLFSTQLSVRWAEEGAKTDGWWKIQVVCYAPTL